MFIVILELNWYICFMFGCSYVIVEGYVIWCVMGVGGVIFESLIKIGICYFC